MDPDQSTSRAIVFGLVLTLALHIVCQGITLAVLMAIFSDRGGYAGLNAIVPLMFIGLSQWVYLVPAILITSKRRPSPVRGILIGGGITILLNGACFGLLSLG